MKRPLSWGALCCMAFAARLAVAAPSSCGLPEGEPAEGCFARAQSLAREPELSQKQAAEQIYRHLLRQQPGNVDYLFGLAQVLTWQGRPEAALPLLVEAQAQAPAYSDLWRLRIQALLSLVPPAMDEARALREGARQRFPGEDWRFPRLDVPVTAVPAPASAEAATNKDAGTSARRAYQLDAGWGQETLSRGLPAWQTHLLRLEWQPQDADQALAHADKWSLGWRETERYRLHDQEWTLGAGWQLAGGRRLQLESSLSATHAVLPKTAFAARLDQSLADGWNLFAGVRQSAYRDGDVRLYHAGVDRYFANERLSYTVYLGGPVDVAPASTHRWPWAHYYGTGNSLALAVWHGRESEQTSSTLMTSRVNGLALSGNHALMSHWGMWWELGEVRQGNLYTRQGGMLGLRHAF